jgi:DNA (cytosine-5)-methyltransferase 1
MAEVLGVDLFSGAGGMSLGAIMAGIQIRVAVEIDVNAAATFRANHPEATVLNQPIQELLSLKLKKKKGDRLVVLGGPPCQGFSTSNQKTRNAENPTNWLFEHYLRVVGMLMPDWVVFENVTGISTTLGVLCPIFCTG